MGSSPVSSTLELQSHCGASAASSKVRELSGSVAPGVASGPAGPNVFLISWCLIAALSRAQLPSFAPLNKFENCGAVLCLGFPVFFECSLFLLAALSRSCLLSFAPSNKV